MTFPGSSHLVDATQSKPFQVGLEVQSAMFHLVSDVLLNIAYIVKSVGNELTTNTYIYFTCYLLHN